MKKLSYHIVLAFIFATQTVWLLGCTHTVETFKCKAECENVTLECSASQKILDMDSY